MARTDPDIALRKIDIVDWNTAVVKQYNIHSIPQVNVYNRGGHLVGTVVGVKAEEVKRYVAQAKTGLIKRLRSLEVQGLRGQREADAIQYLESRIQHQPICSGQNLASGIQNSASA
jgi:hypothetical protein